MPRPRVRDVTVTPHPLPLQCIRRRGTIEIRWTEAAILPTNSDEGQARRVAQRCSASARHAKPLTAAVTGRMKIPSAIQNDSVLSSPEPWARRFSVSGRESTGGHPHGISRRALRRCSGRPARSRAGAFVQSGEVPPSPATCVTKDGAPLLCCRRGQNVKMSTAPLNSPDR